MTAWAVYLVAVSALLGLGARTAEAALQLHGRPVRFVWLVALAAALVAPFTVAVSDRPGVASAEVRAVDVTELAPEAVPAVFAPVQASLLDRLRPTPAVDRAVAGLWVGSALLALVGLAVWFGVVALAPRRWPLRRLDDEEVRLAPRSGPAVFGLLRPSIVVPHWLLGCPEEVRRLALLHEREHVAARDPVLLAAGAGLVALTPWNPVSWWLLARLRAAVELDCDRRVLRRGANVLAYGTMLLGVAGRGAAPRPALALVEPAVLLERRIRAMTERNRSGRRGRTLVLMAGCGLAVLLACTMDGPTAPPEPSPLDAEPAVATLHEGPSADDMVRARVRRALAMLRAVAELGEPGRARIELVVPSREAETRIDALHAKEVVARLLAAQERAADGEIELPAVPELHVADIVLRDVKLEGIELAPTDADVIRLRRKLEERIVLRESTLPAKRIAEMSEEAQLARRLSEVRARVMPPADGVLKLRTTQSNGPEPLVFIDDAPATSRDIELLSPARVDRVEVLKGGAAERLYGEAGLNGVILIYTKR